MSGQKKIYNSIESCLFLSLKSTAASSYTSKECSLQVNYLFDHLLWTCKEQYLELVFLLTFGGTE